MSYPYILTPDQAELLEDALRFYRRHQVETAAMEGLLNDAAQEAEYVIDEIDTVLPLLNEPQEIQITPKPEPSPAPREESERSPRFLQDPDSYRIIETSPITDGTTAAVQHGFELLAARIQDESDRRFRVFIEDLNTVIQQESTYQLDKHTLSDREVFDALTVILRVAQQSSVPEVINDPLD